MMTRIHDLLKNRGEKRGMFPGELAHVGERKIQHTQISVWDFDEREFRQFELQNLAECASLKSAESITWINLDGLHDVALLEEFGRIFDLHPLLLEDVLHTRQRPKFEDYGNVLYIVLKMFYPVAEREGIFSEQVSFVLGDNFVLTFQERPGDVFEPIRDRIRNNKGRVRRMKADYLLYALMDTLIDSYFQILEDLGERIEVVEEQLLTDASEQLLHEIYRLKRDVLLLRNHARPVSEALRNLRQEDTPLIGEGVQFFLRDLHDHATEANDLIETLREGLTGIQEIFLTLLNNKLNSVMKVLTMIATIFIPLTFIVGIYGMNFEYMPELHNPWAYPAVLAAMALIFVGMLAYFKRKDWL